MVQRLGREPSYTELGLFSALWSEHCAYKHSRVFLGRLPTRAPHLLQGPGENAGAVDIGDGWAVVFKMESHNHPSFIEPFQGAATGVGGILRDIFTMGARPIAILDSLRFGDPFTEKLLLEACLEAMATGAVVGIQDMGAAGLACCTSEMPARSGTGMDVELSAVPQREADMTPYELLLSESQERMLLVGANGRDEELRRVFAKWELDAVKIGEVTGGPDLVVRHHGEAVAHVPVETLANGPRYEKPYAPPAWLAERRAFDPLSLPEPQDYGETLVRLMGAPTIASKEWAFRQYDQQVGTNTLVLPGSDAAVLRIKGTRRAIAMSTDGSGRQVFLDPRRGAAMAVCEAARNVSCAGGRPLGVTDCMNFGSPERPEILWQFAEAIEGIAEACRALEVPVVGGNVSFYNETSGTAILPTPICGVVGVLEEADRLGTQWFKAAGHRIALLGPDAVSLGGSEYLWTLHGRLAGRLAALDLVIERRVQSAVRAALGAGLVTAAHDCAEGGLAATLAEGCVTGARANGGVGCEVTVEPGRRLDETLFGEGPSRVAGAAEPRRQREVEALMAEAAIPWRWSGT